MDGGAALTLGDGEGEADGEGAAVAVGEAVGETETVGAGLKVGVGLEAQDTAAVSSIKLSKMIKPSARGPGKFFFMG
jgi:hypothetical protein